MAGRIVADQGGATCDRRETITIVLPERGRRLRWTAALTGAFMDHLSRTGNISAAARRIGIDPAQAYYRQRTNAAFRAAWRAALDAGYLTIETQAMAYVLSGGDAAAADTGTGRFDWEHGLRLLVWHDQRRAGREQRGKPPRQVTTREESDALILRRLAVLAKRKQGETAA